MALCCVPWSAVAQRAPQTAVVSSAADRDKPVALEAAQLEGRTGGEVQARGDVRLGQGGLRLETPELRYDRDAGLLLLGGGQVRWARQGDVVESTGGHWYTEDSVGEFQNPRFFFSKSNAGGSGSRVRFLANNRVELYDAALTSCLFDARGIPLREPGLRASRAQLPQAPADLGSDGAAAGIRLSMSTRIAAPPQARAQPGWELRSPRVVLDFDRQEGVAEDAQLRFLGTPVLSLPKLSFPLGEERRSGWLPPTARADTRSGFEISAPYYLNLGPDYDATLTPAMATRRGPSMELELRRLGTEAAGLMQAHWVPQDQAASRSRGALYWQGQWLKGGWSLQSQGLRVSDDDYWKDFGHTQTFRKQTFGTFQAATSLESWTEGHTQATFQPRLLGQQAGVSRSWEWAGLEGQAYARTQLWQALQGADPNAGFVAPYQRSPQVGTQVQALLPGGLDLAVEAEVNRFDRPDASVLFAPTWKDGTRFHTLASLSRPWTSPAGWVIPKLSINAAQYRAQASAPAAAPEQSFSRTIPTLSVDGGLQFERTWLWGERSLVQTLEPRVVYVNTPLRDQRALPNFDSAPKEFNSTSIFSENAFSGVDRVSDAHQMTMGLTSRALDAQTGAEWLRGSVAQRVQFRDQFTTASGAVSTQRLSDILLAAAVNVSPLWGLDSTLQYNPDIRRTMRSVVALRMHPGAGSTFIAAYRYARESAETLEMRANWPLWRSIEPNAAEPAGICTLMVTGAARINYNTREGKIADSLYGLEWDSGCWVVRAGLQRQSTGVTEAITRLIVQLELTGLTRARVNPLRF